MKINVMKWYEIMSISNYLKLKDAVIKSQIYFVSSTVTGFIKRTKVFNDASIFGIKPGYSFSFSEINHFL